MTDERDRQLIEDLGDPDKVAAGAAEYDRTHPPLVLDPDSGRPAWYETNILIECRLRVEGQLLTAREAIDPYAWQQMFGGDNERREDFLVNYFLTRNFGRAIMQQLNLRERVFIVLPTDEHDFKRCKDSGDEALWLEGGVRCRDGYMIRFPRQRIMFGNADPLAPPDVPQAMGLCPCRCHRYERSGIERRYLGGRVFDEADLNDG